MKNTLRDRFPVLTDDGVIPCDHCEGTGVSLGLDERGEEIEYRCSGCDGTGNHLPYVNGTLALPAIPEGWELLSVVQGGGISAGHTCYFVTFWKESDNGMDDQFAMNSYPESFYCAWCEAIDVALGPFASRLDHGDEVTS